MPAGRCAPPDAETRACCSIRRACGSPAASRSRSYAASSRRMPAAAPVALSLGRVRHESHSGCRGGPWFGVAKSEDEGPCTWIDGGINARRRTSAEASRARVPLHGLEFPCNRLPLLSPTPAHLDSHAPRVGCVACFIDRAADAACEVPQDAHIPCALDQRDRLYLGLLVLAERLVRVKPGRDGWVPKGQVATERCVILATPTSSR